MKQISRRRFVEAGAAGVAVVGSLAANPLGMPIGCQLWPVRDALAKDFEGTLKQLASIGFQTIEMCSPPGYQSSGFGTLMNMSAAEMRRKIQAAGLRCESSHYSFRELKENLPERIAFAKELGLQQMVLASFGLPDSAVMADWTKAATDLNKIGEATQKAGIQLGFHNHNNEFKEIGGVLIYDQLMKTFDPKLVKMQFQVAVISIGFETAKFLRKYPGRMISMHLADWSATEKKAVPIGKGVVDWKDLFAAAKTAGVKNYFVEMNLDLMQASLPYLHGLK